MTKTHLEHILIIGGGVGGALAHDLTLRGFRVTLVEKGELLSGTTGRHHGLLHSGGRYAFNDVETARECYQENLILKRIAPQAIEPNGGLFVALDDEDLSHQNQFMVGCRDAGIPTQVLTPAQGAGQGAGLESITQRGLCRCQTQPSMHGGWPCPSLPRPRPTGLRSARSARLRIW